MALTRIIPLGSLLFRQLLLVGLLASRAWAAQAPAVSNITSDGSLPTPTTVAQSGNIFNIGGGTRPGGGGNLFHSFRFFTVAQDDTANFVNTSGLPTSNILGRVTGGQPSSIFGTIQTTDFPGANLFLINPFGWIFGPTASLNVSGSFHVSTANYILLDGGVRFDAAPGPSDALLTADPPTAFGFLGPNPPVRILVEGSILAVPEGQTLSLVGGDAPFPLADDPLQETGLKITGATLSAPSGRIQIASVASAGEVTIPDLDVGSFSSLGQINISANSDGTPSLLDASDISGLGGGTVVIRGGRLFVDQSKVSADTLLDVDGAPVAIDIQIAGDVVLTTGALLSASALFGAGRGGDINLTADSVDISGRDSFSNASGFRTETLFGTGAGGQLTVSAQSLTMDDGGTLTTTTSSEGAGGAITLNVGSLNMTGGATINSNTGFLAPGGNITVNANSATIAGQDSFGSSGIFVSSIGDGPAGDISMNVATLNLTGGARIENGSPAFDPQGGNVSVVTSGSIVISEKSGISSQAAVQDAGIVSISTPSLLIDNGFISTSTLETGRAGDVMLNVGSLTLRRGGQVTSSSDVIASGSGGNISVTATGPISISGSSPDGLSPNPFGSEIRSGLFSTASGTGSGGQISVSAPNIRITNDGVISAVSSGTFDALGASPGNAGNVNIVVGDTLRMLNGTITTEAKEAAGGDITITHTGSLLHLTNSQITTSVNGGDGGGGNITIGAELDPVTLEPVNVNPFDFIVLNNSGIHANAFGGPGGNVNIFSNLFLSSLPIEEAVTASSQLSTPGTIDIQANIVDVSGDISQLPEAPLQATELLRASCAARLAGGKSSSLVLAGRGGLPAEPGGLLASPPYLGAHSAISSESHRLAGDKLNPSQSMFSLLGPSGERFQLGMGRDHFQLAKSALGLGCSY